MILRLLLIVIAAAGLTLTGCKDKQPTPPTEPAEVKVTPENLDTELDKMEADIEADIAAEK